MGIQERFRYLETGAGIYGSVEIEAYPYKIDLDRKLISITEYLRQRYRENILNWREGRCSAKSPFRIARPFSHSKFPHLSTFVSTFLRIYFNHAKYPKEPVFNMTQSLQEFELFRIPRVGYAFLMHK